MAVHTADLADAHPEKVSVLGPGFQHYGGAEMFEGEALTISLERNNSDLVALLRDENGQGKVVVVDVAQAYYAVVGEMLMQFAQTNGYAGIIVNGYIRDTQQIKDIPVGLYALGTCPRKYIPVTGGKRDIDLSFGGIDIKPGDYVYSDADGVVVSEAALPAS